MLEYRVWCHPHDGAENLADDRDYYFAFESFEEAEEFSKSTKGSEKPLVLILQREFIDEPESGKYVHMKAERLTEWPVEFLGRPRRQKDTIPNFMSPDAP